ncbi:hypothetical protein EDM54_04595 [Brevibacillus borstelensis]|nr:hypothetical protein EDM54_04595 [Brevibacillus borstelensis]
MSNWYISSFCIQRALLSKQLTPYIASLWEKGSGLFLIFFKRLSARGISPSAGSVTVQYLLIDEARSDEFQLMVKELADLVLHHPGGIVKVNNLWLRSYSV